ncbi:MAG: serine/threonine-protein kinase [Rubripirellula sp.]
MPYVRGESLQKRLDREGPLRIDDILRVAYQTAQGLAAAHSQGLVHRDIKPANILLADGAARVLITDFGLARAADDASLTRSGVIAGTPQYMSPEQARGESIDARSDLFSLGSVVYAMATGRIPFRAETPYGILRRITDEEPRSMIEINLEVPAWLGRITDKLHAKAPDDRYQSASEVAELIRMCLSHLQTPSLPLPPELTTRRPGSSHRTTFTIFAVVFAVILGGVGWTILSIPAPVPVVPRQPSLSDTRWNVWNGPSASSILHKSEQLEQEIENDW